MATTPHSFKVGDILSASWGYDQTNWDFYQVVRATAASVVLAKLETLKVPISDRPGTYSLRDKVSPGLPVGEELRRKVHRGEHALDDRVWINEYTIARRWDGKVKEATCYA